jgi:hypothetical protein
MLTALEEIRRRYGFASAESAAAAVSSTVAVAGSTAETSTGSEATETGRLGYDDMRITEAIQQEK